MELLMVDEVFISMYLIAHISKLERWTHPQTIQIHVVHVVHVHHTTGK